MKELDKMLKNLTGQHTKPYGGKSLVFSGDFHQLKPICSQEEVLYSGSPGAISWEQTLNCAVFLNSNHRFKDDPEYGVLI